MAIGLIQMGLIRLFIKYCLYFTLMTAATTSIADNKTASAIFAAGCFWCAEHDFAQLKGVKEVISGYSGGQEVNPTYEEVSSGTTGHFEAIKVVYYPDKISYQDLLNFFWHNIDPLDEKGQFCDKGKQYRAVIFYGNDEEKKLAEQSKTNLLKSGQFNTIATLILPASAFYPAETYHQHYSEKNPLRYKFYRYTCGRDQRLKEIWVKN